MKLEAGKRYVLRNGKVTGPLESTSLSDYPFMSQEPMVISWTADGHELAHREGIFDIVSEYDERDAKEQACYESLCGVTATDATGIGAPKPVNRDEALAELVAEGQRLGMYDTPAVRQFSTGATRNLDHNKLDYEGFNCPMAQRAFAEYMHGHRKQADGTVRDSDNWQKGMGFDVYAKSLVRHVHDFHCLHRGWAIPRPEDGKPMTPDDEHKLELLCAIWFNVQGYIHELLKAKVKCESSSAG